MSHEVLTDSTGAGKMFSVREVPWHSLGNILPAYPKSVDEIMTAAGYENVVELPISTTLPDGTAYTLDSHKVIASVDRNVPLSVMSSSYTLITARPMVEFAFEVLGQDATTMELESLLSDDGEPPIKFETGMNLYGGKVITLMARVPQSIMVGGVDAVDLYIAFVNSYDGSQKFGCHVTPIREVCANTLAMGLRAAVQSWSVKHTSKAMDYVDEARKTLNLTSKYAAAFKTTADTLIDQPFTTADMESLVRDVFPKQSSDAAPFSPEQYGMIGLLQSSPTIDDTFRMTRWGAYNAVREWDDWGRKYNDTDVPVAERRTIQAMFGSGKKRGDAALSYLMAGVGASKGSYDDGNAA
jgi:phage/plasmid-like protein (TIGR03299 family)